jgi:hypothetical protein
MLFTYGAKKSTLDASAYEHWNLINPGHYAMNINTVAGNNVSQ